MRESAIGSDAGAEWDPAGGFASSLDVQERRIERGELVPARVEQSICQSERYPYRLALTPGNLVMNDVTPVGPASLC